MAATLRLSKPLKRKFRNPALASALAKAKQESTSKAPVGQPPPLASPSPANAIPGRSKPTDPIYGRKTATPPKGKRKTPTPETKQARELADQRTRRWLHGHAGIASGKPLPIGTLEVLRRARPEWVSNSSLRRVMAEHCRAISYLQQCAKPGAQRHDLTGKAVAKVTDSEQQYARDELARQRDRLTKAKSHR